MTGRRTPRRFRDPRQARFMTWASLRWVVRHRAWTPYYLVRYWRFLRFRLRRPDVVTEGFVFLGRGADVETRRGYGRAVLGRWVHIGDGTKLRCHEGNLRVGEKSVFGGNNVINCYLDIEFGPACLLSDWIYICDFDHVFTDTARPIKDQGIAKSPVRIGGGGWIATKVTITRGVTIGAGAVIAANAVVTRDIPAHTVAGGVPARVLRHIGAAQGTARQAAAAEPAAGVEAARGGQVTRTGAPGGLSRPGRVTTADGVTTPDGVTAPDGVDGAAAIGRPEDGAVV